MVLPELLASSPALLAGLCFVLGLMVGSFLNVVIYRMPVMMQTAWQQEARAILGQQAQEPEPPFNLVVPRSRCPQCGHAIAAYENIPLLSWLVLRGKCSQCGTGISARYPAVELVTGVASAVLAMHFGYGPWLAATLVATWMLIAMAMIDYDTSLLPDQLTLPLMWGGLLAALTGISPVALDQAVIGAMAGYLSLWSVYWLFKLATGKEGMGFGDFKLLAALGAWLGWQMLPLVILLSSVVGAIVGGLLIALNRSGRAQPMPFGPFLASAGWIALLWGPDIIDAYLGLMRF